MVFLALLAFGVFARLLCEGLPNVAPVAAIAIFAGYYYRNWMLAAVTPLVVMTISDVYFGAYNIGVMIPVYAAMALPVAFRQVLRKYVKVGPGEPRSAKSAVTSALTLLTTAAAGSLLFFAISNLAVWLRGGSYPFYYERSWAGFTACFGNALPFFRFTITGDIGFVLGLFGVYCLATNLGWVTQPADNTPRAVAAESGS